MVTLRDGSSLASSGTGEPATRPETSGKQGAPATTNEDVQGEDK